MSFITETNEQYSARAGVRASLLKEILRSPAHARELMMHPKEPTPQMELGIAVHSAILEPDTFEKYIAAPKFDKRTKEGKAAAADFESSNAGRIPIDEEKYKILEGCVKSVYAHASAGSILSDGRTELTVQWRDGEFDLMCKARPDLYKEGLCVDVKTTSDASPEGFSRQIANLRYHVQAFHYLRGLTAATGTTHETFLIVAVETKAPFAVATYQLDFGTLEKAEAMWRKAMGLYAQCITLNEWPAYSENIQQIGLPAWAFMEDET